MTDFTLAWIIGYVITAVVMIINNNGVTIYRFDIFIATTLLISWPIAWIIHTFDWWENRE